MQEKVSQALKTKWSSTKKEIRKIYKKFSAA